MTIQSSIKELGLFELFQVLHLNRKTGRLIIYDAPGNNEAQVNFLDGSVCFAVIHSGTPKSIFTILVDWGLLDENSVDKLDDRADGYEGLLECLEGEGISSRTHLESYFARRIREYVYEVFKWDSGEYRFMEEEPNPKHEIVVPLNTENLILEGARRIDEWSNIKSKVPSTRSIFRLCPGNDEGHRLNLKPREWEILSLIDGKRTVSEVNDAVNEDLFTTSKLIYGLVVMSVIELVNDESAEDQGVDTEIQLRDLVKSGMDYYGKLNLDKAASEFEKALRIDPDCFDALRMLGEIFYKMDRLSEALVYLQKARSIRPNNQKAMFIKGYLHAHMGEVQQAIKEWEELREQTANPRIVELVRKRVAAARKWDKVLQEY